MQEWAYTAWNDAQGPLIKADEVDLAYRETLATLDTGFFRVQIERLTKTEIQFVKAMASLGDGPFAVADIAKTLGRSQTSFAPLRASIINKGMIYSTGHGYLDFTQSQAPGYVSHPLRYGHCVPHSHATDPRQSSPH